MKHALFFFLLSLLASAGAVAQLSIRDTTFKSIAEDTTDVDLATYPNNIILDSGSGTNLARGRSATVRYAKNDPLLISTQNYEPSVMFDGKTNTYFQLLPGQEGTQLLIDLQATRVVNRVVTRAFSHPNFRVRGYTIYIGRDSINFRKVKQVVDNPESNGVTTDDLFDSDTARFVLLGIDKMDPTRPVAYSTLLAEIEIYGTGYLAEGTFTSKPRDMKRGVNWGRVRWDAVTPENTSITIQARTSDSQFGPWSPWCDPVTVPNSLFRVYEPRRYMQYRAQLATQTIATPRLISVEFDYDTTLVCQLASAKVTPQSAPIMKQVTVQHETSVQIVAGNSGIDSLVIQTEIPLEVQAVTMGSQPVAYAASFDRPGYVAIGFASTITTSTTLRVGLRLTPYLLQHSFPCYLVSNANPGNPQQVDAAIIGGAEAWTLTSTGVPDQVIMDARADPNPFTPNADGLNDKTYFSFFVSNLTVPRPVRLKVYDVTGRKVRTVLDVFSSAQAFVEQNAVEWDGTDDSGRLLPPGVYIFQITVDVDGSSPAVVTKTVTIAY